MQGNKLIRPIVVLTLLFMTSRSSVAYQNLESAVDILVVKHEEVLGKIYAGEVHILCINSKLNGESDQSPVRRTIWAFDLRDSRERQRNWLLSMPQEGEDGKPINCYDYYTTNETAESLVNWDWDRSPPLEPAFQGSVRAYTGGRETLLRGPALNPRGLLLFDIMFSGRDPWSLRQFLSSASRVEVMGVDARSIRARHPYYSTQGFGKGVTCQIHFASNGLIDELLFEFEHEEGGTLQEKAVVTSFTEPASGIYFPEKVVESLTRKKDSLVSYEIVSIVEKLLVNTALPSEAFAFKFPENALVVDLDIDPEAGKENYDMYLWGVDGPKAQLSSATELSNYTVSKRFTGFYGLLIAASLCVGALVLLLIWFKRKV